MENHLASGLSKSELEEKETEYCENYLNSTGFERTGNKKVLIRIESILAFVSRKNEARRQGYSQN